MTNLLNAEFQSDAKIEVHRFYSGTITACAVLAVILQAFLRKYGPWMELVDLPLLVTIYFGMSRRNSSTGLLLGAAIGLLQDALGHGNPIGLYGMAKTILGYVASSIGARIDTEHPVSRVVLVFVFFHMHQAVLAITQRVLLNQAAPFITLRLLLDSAVTAASAVVLFALLDRLRRPS